MSWALLKATTKANWMLTVIFSGIVLIYVTTAASMFNPESAEQLEAMLDLMPEGLIRAMGFVNLGTDLTVYLANYLYGFIMIIFPLAYCVIMANRLIAKHVDSGSMVYLLTTPNTRVRIALTQAVYLVVSLAVIVAVSLFVAILFSESKFPGMLDIAAYLELNLVTYLSLLVVSGVGFLSSCSFSQTRYSLAVGAGVPILFFILKMLSELSDEIEFLRYFSVFSFINIGEILGGPGYTVLAAAVLLPLALVLFAIGVVVFDRRSLAI